MHLEKALKAEQFLTLKEQVSSVALMFIQEFAFLLPVRLRSPYFKSLGSKG